ncbi:DNA (cytosine-5-)-methyltransferase [Tenacibaculum maritimum]|uniref:DNA cytosine methyltransferase n=1 Tax=Tenacibaculum maritimum TaxID=107401 RepID=UPI0012E6B690|nr:DNA (cytosine-5-)-methyltransferase [Tenacibaculum maritimum]CAA0254026.1 Cytosine-specific methyltransferase [Tenacibaculum maritimum]
MNKNRPHKYPYNWTIKDSTFTKDKFKVFSCFACGGGSSFGYKLAGGDVIGMNEIDPKMGESYIENHNPKYAYIEPIQELKNRKDLPKELFELDILDGSPPCSSFSISGNREDDWGKEKKFREGQVKQVLDTLFFDFIELASILKPKITIAENVTGLLKGNAKSYAKKILIAYDKAGYQVKEFVLNSSRMGVPQKRERVFFIAIRKDLAPKLPQNPSTLFNDFPLLDLVFFEDLIPFSEIKEDGLNDFNWTDHDQYVWNHREYGDKRYADTLIRIENRDSNFNAKYIYPNRPVSTIASSDGSKMTLFDEPRRMNTIELIRAQSFPSDYDFKTDTPSAIKYLLGMSVPPVMMAQIASRIYEQWLKILK